MSELTYRGTELRPSDRSMYFWISQGFDDEVEARGEDVVIPGKSGRLVTNRVADRRLIELTGYVNGTGASETAARAAYRALIDTLHTLFDPTLAPGALVVYSPVMGLASGSKSINARYIGAEWGDWVAGLSRITRIHLECVASPPNWT